MLAIPHVIPCREGAIMKRSDDSTYRTFSRCLRCSWPLLTPTLLAIGLYLPILTLIFCCRLAAAGPLRSEIAEPSSRTHSSGSIYHSSLGALHLALRLAGSSTERFLFRLPPDFHLNDSAIHLSGASAPHTAASTPPSATLSLFERKAFLFLTSRRHARPVAVEIALPETGSSLTIQRAKVHRARAGQSVSCDGEQINPPLTPTSKPPAHSLALRGDPAPLSRRLREVEMNIFYDSSFAPAISGRPSDYIAAVVYAANQMYLKRLGVELRVTSLMAIDIPDGSSSDNLLDRFRAAVRPTAESKDLSHLFTGASLEPGTAGVAYVGSVCINRGDYAVGLSRSVAPALQTTVFTHEVMHGLGATHDDSPYSIMSPVLTTQNRRLSKTTRSSVAEFLELRGGCTAPLTPLSAALEIGFPAGLFSAHVLVNHPRTAPCEVLLQGRMLSAGNRPKRRMPPFTWKEIAQLALPVVGAADTSSIRLTAPAPSTQNGRDERVGLRALVRCADKIVSSRVKRASPPRIEAVGASDLATGDWFDQLAESIRVSPGDE